MSAEPPQVNVSIEKLVPGGQGLGTLSDGRKVFVWNALPGETVAVRLIKQKRSYAEGIAEEIIDASTDRIAPQEPNYLATSPWQIMTFATENHYKKQIVVEVFSQAQVALPDFRVIAPSDGTEGMFHYRNKMEYSFWGDEQGLHLALHQRGSHNKHIVTGSALALPAIDAAAHAIVMQLQRFDMRAGDMKTIIVRTDQAGHTVAALFVKLNSFPRLELPPELQGIRVYYSDPRSPASVRTKLLYEQGDVCLQDDLLGTPLSYDVDSFFQVNVPAFERALKDIKAHLTTPTATDMYAGVGSIGLSVATERADLIELDPATAAMARLNAMHSSLHASVIEASTEKALEYIDKDTPVLFDPPRAGLHHKVIDRILDVRPPQIVYLSCNPATQARDLALLQQMYHIDFFAAYNFFPRTPHIETLATLTLKA